MSDALITAYATGLLVVVGSVQALILLLQIRQSRIATAADYRKRWHECRASWETVIFVGRHPGDYYQLASPDSLDSLKELVSSVRRDAPTIWARRAVQEVCSLLSDVCLRILKGELRVSDIYYLFGSELLRQGNPLRTLLDRENYEINFDDQAAINHSKVRHELQEWLIYHDGLRRRCLILIDLLWAEAARLEDLPPIDLRCAAEAKTVTGHLNRERLVREILRLGKFRYLRQVISLWFHLRRSEFKSKSNWFGIDRVRNESSERTWVDRLLSRGRSMGGTNE
jgi:hypothetical protein